MAEYINSARSLGLVLYKREGGPGGMGVRNTTVSYEAIKSSKNPRFMSHMSIKVKTPAF